MAACSSSGVWRSVQRVVVPERVKDGAGVSLRRCFPSRALDNLDGVFLLLDEFRGSEPFPGFPDHSHRGFETVSYMIAGEIEHRDNKGNHGILSPGSIQWMTAGRGITHSEMPRQVDGYLHGYQLWVNLPSHLKMTEPRYQDIPPKDVPEVKLGEAGSGGVVRVLAGEYDGVRGPVRDVFAQPTYLDVRLSATQRFEQPIPPHHACMVYVIDGAARFSGGAEAAAGADGAHTIEAGTLGIFAKDGEGVRAVAEGDARFLLVSAAPIDEPIARAGPFVMNTREELLEAFADAQAGRI